MKEGIQVGRQGMKRNAQLIPDHIDFRDLEMGDVIGKGASGVVQRAVHKPSGLQLAIKLIGVYEKEKRKQVMNDIKALEHADCPFLVKFYGAFYNEGQVKLALELMDAGSLRDLIRRVDKPIVPEPILAKITQQVLNGLMYLHRVKHQVHRDIKPDNVLINSTGAVKLSDFGIAKELGVTVGICITYIGTMIYMSPERIIHKKYSYSSDLWSLGLMLIELAIGSYPYPKGDGTQMEIIESILHKPEPVLPESFNPEFRDFVSHCVRKNPEERWSAVQLAAHPWVLRYSQDEVDLCGWINDCLNTSY